MNICHAVVILVGGLLIAGCTSDAVQWRETSSSHLTEEALRAARFDSQRVVLSANGKYSGYVAGTGEFSVVEKATGDLILDEKRYGTANHLAFTPDEKVLAVALKRGGIRFVQLETDRSGFELPPTLRLATPVRHIQFASKSRHYGLIVVTDDRRKIGYMLGDGAGGP